MLYNLDRRKKNPFSQCLQYFILEKKKKKNTTTKPTTEWPGAVKHWFNGLWCHRHAQRGTLGHTQTHPGCPPAVVSLESTSICTLGMLLRHPEPNPDFQGTLMSPGGGRARPGSAVTHFWHWHLLQI